MYAKVAVNTAYSSNVIQYRDYNFSPPLSLSLSLSLSIYLSIYLSIDIAYTANYQPVND